MSVLRSIIFCLLFLPSFVAAADVWVEDRTLPPTTAPQIVRAVHKDLATIPMEFRCQIRYLTCYHISSLAARQEFLRVLNGHINGLSVGPRIKHLLVVPGTDYGLLRVELPQFRINADKWEKLVEDEIYYQTEVKVTELIVDWPGGVWRDGKFYKAKEFQTKIEIRQGPHLVETADDRILLAEINAWTISRMAFIRGDWFHYQTCAQEDRKFGYYGMLGIKNQGDFEKLLRFDRVLAKDLEVRAIPVKSGIMNNHQLRRVERIQTVLGGRWATYDSAKTTGEKNPLVFLDDDLKYDATEQLGPLPNGMMLWYLGDFDGSSQGKAPDQIVGGDKLGNSNDTRLHVNLSCIRCHFGWDDESRGFRPFTKRRITKIQSPIYDVKERLEALYFTELDTKMVRDKEIVSTAVREATAFNGKGWSTLEYARAYQKYFSLYYDDYIDLDRAAYELGLTGPILKVKLEEYRKATGAIHPTLSILLNGDSIGRTHWEEVLGLTHTIIRSVNLIPQKGE